MGALQRKRKKTKKHKLPYFCIIQQKHYPFISPSEYHESALESRFFQAVQSPEGAGAGAEHFTVPVSGSGGCDGVGITRAGFGVPSKSP